MLKQFGDAAISMIGRTASSDHGRAHLIISTLMVTEMSALVLGAIAAESSLPRLMGQDSATAMLVSMAGVGSMAIIDRPASRWCARAFKQLVR